MDDSQADLRRKKRMARVDAMSPELRACVHEYGLTIVMAFLDHHISDHRTIHHLVRTVREGSYEIGREGQGADAWKRAS